MRPFAAALGASLVVQVAFAVVAPVLVVEARIGFAVAFAMVAGAAVGCGATAPTLGKTRALGLLLTIPVLALLAVYGGALPEVALAAAIAALLLGAGALTGALVGGRIEDAGHLLVVGSVTTLADLYSVLSPRGVTAQIVSNERLLGVLTISWAMPGQDGMFPVIGLGDIVMVAMYLSAARALGLSLGRSIAGLAVGFAAVLGALLVFEEAVPALPFLAVGFLAANPRCLRLRPEDRRPAAVGLAVAVGVFGAGLWLGVGP
ncbi:MAG: hypothetical protein JRH11_04980 [Deltaproteobacteria bacterium]|nr:hypothetical protein [Deltaproteobacteria bacterium]